MIIKINCDITAEELQELTDFVRSQETTDREYYQGDKNITIVLNDLGLHCKFDTIHPEDGKHIERMTVSRALLPARFTK